MAEEIDNPSPEELPSEPPPSDTEELTPTERERLFEEATREADRHKWIESEKAGYDMGDHAIRQWHKDYWRSWCRERWVEHLRGDRFWIELDKGDYGLLRRKFNENWNMIERIVERIKEGGENLDIIQWASDKGFEIDTVLDVLKTLDINSRRLAPPSEFHENDTPVAEEESLTGKATRVLIVDDDEDTRVLLKELFEGQGVEAHLVSSGEEALQEVGKRRYHAYLIDIMLPGKHGAEVAWHLRRHGINTPVIAISAVLDRWNDDDLYDCGFTGVMSKPFNLAELRELAQEMIRDDQKNKSVTPNN